MPIAFAISRSEEDVARKVFTDGDTGMDGGLFYFRGADSKPTIAALIEFAVNAEDPDEAEAAMRLSGRLGQWVGQSVAEQAAEAPSPAPKRRGKNAERILEGLSELADTPVDSQSDEA